MAHQNDRLDAMIFTSLDRHLLRKCPCPVCMVKDKVWPNDGAIVVAVNLSNEESYHDKLNIKLIKETENISHQIVKNPHIHLVSAYPVAPINIAIELPDFDPNIYNQAMRAQHLVAMKKLRQRFTIDEKYTNVVEGSAEKKIPEICDELHAGIVVFILGRTGISAAFLGNTAEQIIDKLKCDLLAINQMVLSVQ